MQKNSSEFSMHDAMRIAKSPAGQQLLAMLQKQDTNALQEAAQQASAGNYEQAKQSLSALLQNEDIQALLKQFGG